eukprot:CAMPEP_0194752652 /NCGR_PEP_ID=MMETSP0323_2-20130528/6478_1 /TAXON_ID=2866 ORGANISM="Crypthecodinium cohnii, Strain Seligo" /NCGR_SAMPLE_ID=MMETSP0323_2 /ASSEMBLY_ACC=CAM_ASM_000346 /LENGTH=154 /DNA_ID=CAMNT_0039669757 /DNA_START=288 /DNA_END=749 /DNA_ORIENTATION=-
MASVAVGLWEVLFAGAGPSQGFSFHQPLSPLFPTRSLARLLFRSFPRCASEAGSEGGITGPDVQREATQSTKIDSRHPLAVHRSGASPRCVRADLPCAFGLRLHHVASGGCPLGRSSLFGSRPLHTPPPPCGTNVDAGRTLSASPAITRQMPSK